MLEMEKVLHYILDHIEERLTPEMVAGRFDYTTVYFLRKFSAYFECPFAKFVSKLQLRRAAAKLKEGLSIKNIREKYGYSSTESFSKAFHKEFGVSPREFCSEDMLIPDMPLRRQIGGYKIEMYYTHQEDLILDGKIIVPHDGVYLNLSDQPAWAFRNTDEPPALKEGEDWFGIWWSDKNLNLFYILGTSGMNIWDDPNMLKQKISGGNYAVFTIERKGGESGRQLADISRMLSKYIFEEWRPLNQKVVDGVRCVFERFEGDGSGRRSYIYVPMLMLPGGSGQVESDKGVDAWINYIDAHIMEDLTVKKLAEHFNYSSNHFADVFHMYYQMPPLEYIEKRRLYMLAKDLKEKKLPMEELAKKYHFGSLEDFNHIFYEHFGVSPEAYGNAEMNVVDLGQYYLSNRYRLRVSYVYLEDFHILARELNPEDVAGRDTLNIAGEAEYWMKRDYPCLEHTRYACSSPEKQNKIGLWDKAEGGEDESAYVYVIGPVVDVIDTVPEGMKPILIEGGKYAMFESENVSDEEVFIEVYNMMTRCVFYGWVKEYRVRTDLNRLTFVRYRRNKLYFYVPINE